MSEDPKSSNTPPPIPNQELATQVLNEEVDIDNTVVEQRADEEERKGIKKFLNPKLLIVLLGIFFILIILLILVARPGNDVPAAGEADGEIVWWLEKKLTY